MSYLDNARFQRRVSESLKFRRAGQRAPARPFAGLDGVGGADRFGNARAVQPARIGHRKFSLMSQRTHRAQATKVAVGEGPQRVLGGDVVGQQRLAARRCLIAVGRLRFHFY